jgi:hypothetical protein
VSRPPGEGRGFFPGDDLSHMPSGGRQAEWLKVSMVAGYREYVHDPETGTSRNLLTGITYQDRYRPADWDELIRSLREDGFREPLKLEYEPDARQAFFGEGNHRLVAAGLAGHSAVPVQGLKGYPGERMRGARRVPGEPELKRDEEHGYFPGSFRPSDVLPRRYRYMGENPQFCTGCDQEYPRDRGPEHVAGEHPAQWRRAWERHPRLREKYPHLAPGTAAQAVPVLPLRPARRAAGAAPQGRPRGLR